MERSILIRNGTLVTMDNQDAIVAGDLFVSDGKIERVGHGAGATSADTVIDATGCALLPGFVQTHVHLCQTLFRGSADDLALIDWLRKRVWPMEAALDAASIRASAQLGVAEMIKGGTTCALTMETVNHTHEVFRVIEETGFRATVGKCMMDKGDEVPAGMFENASDSIKESLALLDAWHGRAAGRIRYCFAPRFAISCSRELLEKVAALARERGVMIHTHASENRTEIEIVESETGMRNILYLDSLGLTGDHVLLAHCVHLDDAELDAIQMTGTNVSHCPSSNLKLSSGIAPVAEMLKRGISVSLGCDGAACNNRMDMWTEMRTASLLQKVMNNAETLPAAQALRMATIDGARALGLGDEIGSLEAGKRADLMVVNLDRLHSTPRPVDIISSLVFSAQPEDVETVIIDGRIVMRDRVLQTLNEAEVIEESNLQAQLLRARAGLATQ